MPYSLRWVAGLFACAFLVAVVSLTVQWMQTRREATLMAEPLAHGNVQLGKAALRRYQCGSCHTIPGLNDATGDAGPALNGVALRKTIAGHFDNSPETLEAWIRFPKEMDPAGGMPDQGVTAKDSRDIAAYLYTKR